MHVGDLSPDVTETLLQELFTQVGLVESVYLPRERLSGKPNGYAFVEMQSIVDADYAAAVMQGVPLFGRPLRINRAGSRRLRGPQSVGAKLFVGRLDPSVSPQLLEQLFSPFGALLSHPTVHLPDSDGSSAHAFLDFATFEASDLALQTMEGHHVMGRPLHLEYAINKAANGAKHGSPAERELAKRLQANSQSELLRYLL